MVTQLQESQIVRIDIPGEPVTWSAHAGFGRRSFNPRFKEKEYFQWEIKKQYKGKPISGPVCIIYTFAFPIPKSYAKKRQARIMNGDEYCLLRKDVTNLIKFTEDCLKGIVIVDDSQVVHMQAKKIYSHAPETQITIIPCEETWTNGSSTSKSSTTSSEAKPSTRNSNKTSPKKSGRKYATT